MPNLKMNDLDWSIEDLEPDLIVLRAFSFVVVVIVQAWHWSNWSDKRT